MKTFGYVSFLNQTEEVERLLEGLEQGKLVTSKCSKCGEVYLPPRSDCAACISSQMVYEEISPQATLYTYTIIHFAPESMVKMQPYIVAVGEFSNGARVLAHLHTTPSKLKVGMPIKLTKQELEGDRMTYKFVG